MYPDLYLHVCLCFYTLRGEPVLLGLDILYLSFSDVACIDWLKTLLWDVNGLKLGLE
jgi:hypothetical protein